MFRQMSVSFGIIHIVGRRATDDLGLCMSVPETPVTM